MMAVVVATAMWAPHRRPRVPEDPFFAEGNAGRAAWTKHTLAAASAPAAATAAAAAAPPAPLRYRCAQGGCGYTGASAFELEAHYASAHTHVCSTCRRILPTARLLELHVLETHDVLFKLMAEREKMVRLDRSGAPFDCVQRAHSIGLRPRAAVLGPSTPALWTAARRSLSTRTSAAFT